MVDIYHRCDRLTAPSFGFSTTGPCASYSTDKPGFDAGAGFSFERRWRAKFYAEARYNRMFTNEPDTDFIPVIFGVRW